MPAVHALIDFFENGIAFNKHLGMKVVELREGFCRLKIPFRPELVGDPFRPALHGGVISALADTAGGLAVFASVGTPIARVSTVDLRVDYYAPAGMEDLYADAQVMRLGNRVGVARIQVHHHADFAGDIAHLLAEGKGVYNVHKTPPVLTR